MSPTRGPLEGGIVAASLKPRGVGAWASVALGLTYIFVGAGFLLQPEAQRSGSVDETLASLATDSLGFSLLNWSLAIGGLAAFAAIPWITRRLEASRGWTAWAGNLGLVGFAATAVNSFRNLNLAPDEAENYVHQLCDEACRLAVRGDFVHLSLDPDGWMTFGAVGLFVLITTVIAARRHAIAIPLAVVGVAVGVAYWLVVIGNLFEMDSLIGVAAAVGGVILAPIFYIGLGLTLKDSNQRELENALER